jgi:hypothetical protein
MYVCSLPQNVGFHFRLHASIDFQDCRPVMLQHPWWVVMTLLHAIQVVMLGHRTDPLSPSHHVRGHGIGLFPGLWPYTRHFTLGSGACLLQSSKYVCSPVNVKSLFQSISLLVYLHRVMWACGLLSYSGS